MKPEQLFIGEVWKVLIKEPIIGTGATLSEIYWPTGTRYTSKRVKVALLKKVSYSIFVDLETGKKYETSYIYVGDVYVDENTLHPFMAYLQQEEKDKNITKGKSLKLFKNFSK